MFTVQYQRGYLEGCLGNQPYLLRSQAQRRKDLDFMWYTCDDSSRGPVTVSTYVYHVMQCHGIYKSSIFTIVYPFTANRVILTIQLLKINLLNTYIQTRLI